MNTSSEFILFTTPTCPNCKMAEKIFEKKGIKYKTVDATQRQDLVEKYNISTAPTLLVESAKGEDVIIPTLPKIMNFISK